MAAPVLPSELLELLPTTDKEACEAFTDGLVALNLKYYQLWKWLLDANGNLSSAFFQAARKPGTLVPSFVALNETTDFVLLCDGRAVSRTTYAALFAAIGVTFGTGDGSSTFNLPNVQTRALVGTGNRGATGNDPDITYTLGQTVGEAFHKLTIAEIPAHDHQMSSPLYTGIAAGVTQERPQTAGTQRTGATGGSGAHETRQPSFAIHVYISY